LVDLKCDSEGKKFTLILENLVFIKTMYLVSRKLTEHICGDVMENVSVFLNCKFSAYFLLR